MNGIERFQELAKTSDSDIEIRRGVLRNIVTAELLCAMESLGISKSDLATELNRSKGHISRLLSGDRNMTLDTISDIAVALGIHVSFSAILEGERRVNGDCVEFVEASKSFSFSEPEEVNRIEYDTNATNWGEKQHIKVA